MLLALESVERTYAGPSPVYALRHATFDVGDADLIAVIGRSGSGKSTLLNVLALLDRPTAGEYAVQGRSVLELSDHAQTELRSTLFGFVFQQSFLLAGRTAEENVELALVPRGLSARQRRSRAGEMLGRVGLGHRRGFLPSTLSGGEAQRVAIARALAQDPRVLICDEPTGNLDERTSDEVMGILKEVNRAGVAVIVATHDLAIAAEFPRVLTVRDGVVVESFRPGEAPVAPLSREARSPLDEGTNTADVTTNCSHDVGPTQVQPGLAGAIGAHAAG